MRKRFRPSPDFMQSFAVVCGIGGCHNIVDLRPCISNLLLQIEQIFNFKISIPQIFETHVLG